MSGQAILTYHAADGRAERVVLDPGQETSIGRHPNCTITVSQASVSRKHARVFFEAGGYFVEDLNSSNGTYVNDQRISRVSLADNDRLRCGDFELHYTMASAAAAPPPSDPPKLSLVGKLRPGARASSGGGGLAAPVGRPEPSNRPAPLPTGRGAKPLPLPTGRGGRAPLPTGRGGPVAPVAASGAGDGDAESLARLREEVAHWKAQAEANALLANKPSADPAELETLREQLAQTRQLVNDQEVDIEDKTRRIRDLESEHLRNEEQLQTVTDRNLRMKDEAQRLKKQLEEYRVEKNELDVSLAQVNAELAQLVRNQESAGQTEARLAGDINDLKRQVRERDNRIREVQQELQVVEHDRDAFRKQNEDLQLALDHDEQQRRQLTTQLTDLRQVLDHKEEEIDRLSADVARLEATVGAHQDGGAHVDRLQEALAAANAAKAEARAQLTEAEGQLVALQASLDEALARAQRAERAVTQAQSQAERGGVANRAAIDELNDLKRANRDLRHALEEAQAGAADGARLLALEAAAETLEADLALARAMARDAEARARAAEERVGAAPAATPGLSDGPTRVGPPPQAATAGDYAGLKASSFELYEQLNDIASDILDKARSAAGYAQDLEGVRKVVDSLPLAQLPGPMAAEAQAALEATDMEFVIEDTSRALQATEAGAQAFKDAMRTFRRALREHGYGS